LWTQKGGKGRGKARMWNEKVQKGQNQSEKGKGDLWGGGESEGEPK